MSAVVPYQGLASLGLLGAHIEPEQVAVSRTEGGPEVVGPTDEVVGGLLVVDVVGILADFAKLVLRVVVVVHFHRGWRLRAREVRDVVGRSVIVIGEIVDEDADEQVLWIVVRL